MKKTLLSVLAGLTVMGSAFADGPSVEDRKKLCQLLIDKGTHVWVEKTSACIPVNPCKSDDKQIEKAYCPEMIGINNSSKRDEYIKAYAENAFGSTVTEIKEVGKDGEHTYFGVKTSDGGYFAIDHYPEWETAYGHRCCFVLLNAFDTLGFTYGSEEFGYISESFKICNQAYTLDGLRYVATPIDNTKCNKVYQVAKSVWEDLKFTMQQDSGKCEIYCTE